MRKIDRAAQEQTLKVAGAEDLLPPREARQAEEEARKWAGHTTQGEVMVSRRERVEAETRRVSDEVTRQAQERLRRSDQRTHARAGAIASEQPDDAAQRTRLQTAKRRLPPAVTIGRVLVPLDGTAYAERALPYAARLANAIGASITLAHVRVPSAPLPASHLGGLLAGGNGAKAGVDVADFPTYLHWLREWLIPHVPEVTIELADAPSVLDGLRELEERGIADLVVLATHARQGAERLFLGSVADGLVRTGRQPVFVVPPLAEVPARTLPSLTQILVPLDRSEVAEQALGLVRGLIEGVTRRSDTPEKLVAPGTEGTLQEIMLLGVAESSAARRRTEHYLQAFRELLAEVYHLATPVGIHVRAIVGSPPGAIVDAANQGLVDLSGKLVPSDLLVMATHGRSGVRRWLYGSVTGYVVPRSRVPVVLVCPERR